VTTKREFLSKLSTHQIEELLPPDNFKRIHRSFIVSMSKIESYTADMLEVNGVSVPIGRGYRDIIANL
jgi:DNA-binding LytR/AlgR family response regulator